MSYITGTNGRGGAYAGRDTEGVRLKYWVVARHGDINYLTHPRRAGAEVAQVMLPQFEEFEVDEKLIHRRVAATLTDSNA